MIKTQKIMFGLLALLSMWGLTGCEAGNVVERVSDGDTITVLSPQGEKIKVRFACVDAPEIPHTKKERKSRRVAYLSQFKWGERSHKRVKKLIEEGGNRVVLTITDTDRYGRKVAEVRTPDGTFIQEVLTREGLALAYRPYFKDCPSAEAIEAAENEAKRRRRGVWSDSKFVTPWEYRKFK